MDIQKLFIQACHKAMAQISKQKLSRLLSELEWHGKVVSSFREWLFNFFATYRSEIFVQHQAQFVSLLDEEWKQVQDLVTQRGIRV